MRSQWQPFRLPHRSPLARRTSASAITCPSSGRINNPLLSDSITSFAPATSVAATGCRSPLLPEWSAESFRSDRRQHRNVQREELRHVVNDAQKLTLTDPQFARRPSETPAILPHRQQQIAFTPLPVRSGTPQQVACPFSGAAVLRRQSERAEPFGGDAAGKESSVSTAFGITLTAERSIRGSPQLYTSAAHDTIPGRDPGSTRRVTSA